MNIFEGVKIVKRQFGRTKAFMKKKTELKDLRPLF